MTIYSKYAMDLHAMEQEQISQDYEYLFWLFDAYGCCANAIILLISLIRFCSVGPQIVVLCRGISLRFSRIFMTGNSVSFEIIMITRSN